MKGDKRKRASTVSHTFRLTTSEPSPPEKARSSDAPRAAPSHPLRLLTSRLTRFLPPGRPRPSDRPPLSNRRVLQKLQHRPCGSLPPQLSHRRRLRVSPPAVLSHPLPQPPDLGGPGLALYEKVVARLSLAPATPPALA